MSRILGIDLGTTNSVMAFLENEEPTIVMNKRGEHLTPSVVAYTKNSEVLVGKTAKNQAVINADRTIQSIKRRMGTDYRIDIGTKSYTPQEISAKILQKLKEDAEEYFGEPITKAVITVPAYFNDNQRQATKDAGKIAGLEVTRIINEPTAAALAYGLDKSDQQTILVYDLGGGTFDVSILEIDQGVFEVKATSGNNTLGGDDFDNAMIQHLLRFYKEHEAIDLADDKMAMQKLREEVEKAKIELSERTSVEINIPFISATEEGPKHLNYTIKRAEFEEMISEYIDETIRLTESVLVDAGLTASDIDQILLVGGSTRIPLVQSRVKDVLNKEPVKGINPDEVVALGASIQAGIVAGDKTDMVLVDVTPLSLGIEIEGGIFVPIIKRNATIPITANKLFTTVSDNQKSVEIHVLQGERSRCSENISLGKFQLSGIRKASKGEPRIDVVFNIDVDGIVNVSAQDLDTQVQHEITIRDSLGLSEEEIQQIIEDADQNVETDKAYLTHQKIRTILQRQIFHLNEIYQSNQEHVSDEMKNDVEQLITKVEKELDSDSNEQTLYELAEATEFVVAELTSELEKQEFDSASSM
jgi:molecular chaperone DnaK